MTCQLFLPKCVYEGMAAIFRVHRAVCYACEAAMRRQQRCPYHQPGGGGGGGGSGAGCGGLPCFCPHGGRCCACEAWSCDLCGLHRCDGVRVVTIAPASPHHHQPNAFLWPFLAVSGRFWPLRRSAAVVSRRRACSRWYDGSGRHALGWSSTGIGRCARARQEPGRWRASTGCSRSSRRC
eukprot:COSAG01_NODE_989_length_12296_cov_244.291629_6_plen_180_part_00